MKATLTKLSVCSCGFPALKDDIPLGEVYETDSDKTSIINFTIDLRRLRKIDLPSPMRVDYGEER